MFKIPAELNQYDGTCYAVCEAITDSFYSLKGDLPDRFVCNSVAFCGLLRSTGLEYSTTPTKDVYLRIYAQNLNDVVVVQVTPQSDLPPGVGYWFKGQECVGKVKLGL